MNLLGESDIYMRFALALMVVLGLIVACAWAFRFMKTRQAPWLKKLGPKRLEVLETLILDDKRRLILVRQDSQEHLLLLGNQQESVLDKGAHVVPDIKPLKLKKGKR